MNRNGKIFIVVLIFAAPTLSSQPCRALSCDSNSPSISSKSTPSNSSHKVGREVTPPASPQVYAKIRLS